MGAFDHFPYTNVHELNLSWILKEIKQLDGDMLTIKEWIEQHQSEYEELKDLYDDIMSGNFPDSIKIAFSNWMHVHALDLVGELIDMIIINITDNGYMVMYIPESWDDIIFMTSGLDVIIPGQDYGRLVLSYNV